MVDNEHLAEARRSIDIVGPWQLPVVAKLLCCRYDALVSPATRNV